MRFQGFSSLLLHFLLFSTVLSLTSASKSGNFIQCLTNKLGSTATNIIYSPSNPDYTPILDFLLLNLRYGTPTTPKPQFIVTPIRSHHIQAAVICSKKHSLQIRVRSGGHDYEGFSYVSHQPFVIIDLFNMQDVKVDINRKSAWVQTGATIGKVHYKIAEKSNTLGFPGSICTTVGVGGLIGGGGIGFMWRKYGLSADNILDARIIDVKGRYLNRKSMGEDLFWAIRGGGASSFGVVVAWKLQLVSVPPIVTVFRLPKTIEEGSLPLVHKWQNVAPQFPKDLHMLTLNRVVQAENGTKTIETVFLAVFQGRRKNLVSLMETRFPELGLKPENCTEMSWVNSTMFVFGLNGPVENLLNRAQRPITYWKGGSDYVRKAISLSGLEGLWKVMLEVGDEYLSGMVVTEPMGGRNDEISESAIPFPHRKGNLFMIQYNLNWQNAGDSPRYLAAAKKVYNFMTPFASKSPRSSYFNYRDTNLGVNKDYNTSYKEASVWGIPYFQSNFKKLATVKSKVDPENYFWNEQSIPPFAS